MNNRWNGWMRRRSARMGVHAGLLVALIGGTGSVATVAARPTPPDTNREVLARLGAPAQTNVAGPDSPTSFNATLPNGRRVTPVGTNVQVGENPLNAALTPDGKFLVVTNDDERNAGAIVTKYSGDATNGAGQVPGGFVLSVVRTADMQNVSSAVAPPNPKPNPGPKMPGVTQSDATAAFFLGVAIKPNTAPTGTYTVYAAGGPSDVVNAYTLGVTGTLTLKRSIPVPVPTDPAKPNFGMAAPGGLTLTPDGSKLFVVNNNANTVVTIDTATEQVVGAPVDVGFFPYAAVLGANQRKLYVSNWGVADRNFNSTYTGSYNPATNTGNGSPFIGGVQGNLFANPRTDPARTSSISVLDLVNQNQARPAVSLARPIDGVHIVGGTHPSALTTVTRNAQTALYVTDSNEDQLAIIDTRTDTLVKKVGLLAPLPSLGSMRAPGVTPNALAVSPDQTRLYVAEAGLNAVAVYNVERPFDPSFLGLIPTGWYPTGVTVSADGNSLYVVNAKGFGSAYQFQGAVPGSPDVNLLFGSAQKIDLKGLNLSATTKQVADNTVRLVQAPATSVLNTVGNQIEHVVYILRENKSYDTYFGADAVLNGRGANGKPEYANFNAQVPNTKALAEQFVIGDNVYADAEESDAGHSFALAGTSTDYQQKTLLSRFSRPFINTKNEDPEDYPLAGYIFNNMSRNERSYRNYGDMIRLSGYDDGKNPNPCADDPYPGCNPATYAYTNTTAPTVGLGGLYSEDVPALAVLGDGHTDTNYPGWNLRISDQRRATEFIKDMGQRIASNTVPQFTFVWLPDDHTGGGLDPRFEVADNDAALGRIVDFISHSPIWAHTAMFITQDDAQGSPDHVNAHRTYTMVVSPYAKHGVVNHRLSSTVSIPKTIEELLRMPPMALGDLVANDLSDYFTTKPDFTPYTAKPQAAITAAPAEAQRIAQLTSQLDTRTYDRDTIRLGQVTQLYLDSLALADKAARMSGDDYAEAQDRLYTIAQHVVSAGPVKDGD